jgi:hypothetical protein
MAMGKAYLSMLTTTTVTARDILRNYKEIFNN